MKKFVFRGLCFAAIGLALLCVLNFFYIRTNGYKSLDNTYKFYLAQDNIQVVNLGSSHSDYGIDYSAVEGLKGLNLALPGQGFYYDLKLLEKYQDKLSEGCFVIIPISYFSFAQQKDFNNQHVTYYRFIDYRSVQKHRIVDYIRFKMFPILSAFLNAKYLIWDKDNIEFDVYWLHKLIGLNLSPDDTEMYELDASRHLDYYYEIIGAGGNEDWNLSNLEGIVEFCREHGYKPVFITMPFTNYYNQKFSADFYSDFYETIDDERSKYGISYINYSHDPRFSDHLEFFIDSNHLNETGKKAFTRIMLEDLGVIGDGSN